MQPLQSEHGAAPSQGDYVDFLKHKDDFKWLYNFMSRDHTKEFRTRVVVAKCSNAEISLQLATDSNDALQLLRQISVEASGDVKTRLVILCYEETWSVDRTILKAVAEQYTLPPTFLSAHFFHEQGWHDKDFPPNIQWKHEIGDKNSTPYLLSERKQWIELRTGLDADCLSAFVQHDADPNHPTTIVIFLRNTQSVPGRVRLMCRDRSNSLVLTPPAPMVKVQPAMAVHYEARLQNLTSNELNTGNVHPVEFVLPYAGLLAFQFSKLIEGFDERLHETNFNPVPEEDLRALFTDSVRLREELESCTSVLRRYPSPSSKFQEVLEDLEDLIMSAKKKETEIKDAVKWRISLLALQESKESIQQTRSVRRLTQLAFIFIPLTFVTSCFGMNLTALHSGTGKLWTFFVTALSVTTLVLLVSAYGWQILFRISNILQTHTRPVRVLIRLMQYLPMHTLWMMLFAVVHPFQLGTFLANMGLYYQLLPEGLTEFHYLNTYRPFPHLNLSKFWYCKGEEIFHFFMVAGWRKNTFVRRLMQPKLPKSENATA